MEEKLRKIDYVTIAIDLVLILLSIVGIWMRFLDGSRFPVVLCMAASGIAIVILLILYVLCGMNKRMIIFNVLVFLIALVGLIFNGMEYADRKPSLTETEDTAEKMETDDYWICRQDFTEPHGDYAGTVFGIPLTAKTLEDANVLDNGGIFYANRILSGSETEDAAAAAENNICVDCDQMVKVLELDEDVLIGNFGESGNLYQSFCPIYSGEEELRAALYIDNYTNGNAPAAECAKKNWWHIGSEDNPDILAEMFGNDAGFTTDGSMNREEDLNLLIGMLGRPDSIAVKKSAEEELEDAGETETISLEESLRRFGMDPSAQFAYTLVWEYENAAILVDVVENPTNETDQGVYVDVTGAWFYTKESFAEYKSRLFSEYEAVSEASRMVSDLLNIEKA